MGLPTGNGGKTHNILPEKLPDGIRLIFQAKNSDLFTGWYPDILPSGIYSENFFKINRNFFTNISTYCDYFQEIFIDADSEFLQKLAGFL